MKMSNRHFVFFALTLGLCVLISARATSKTSKTLDIYFIDVEGGQATLIVSPRGESLLVGVILLSFEDLMSPKKSGEMALRAVTWADATIDVHHLTK